MQSAVTLEIQYSGCCTVTNHCIRPTQSICVFLCFLQNAVISPYNINPQIFTAENAVCLLWVTQRSCNYLLHDIRNSKTQPAYRHSFLPNLAHGKSEAVLSQLQTKRNTFGCVFTSAVTQNTPCFSCTQAVPRFEHTRGVQCVQYARQCEVFVR